MTMDEITRLFDDLDRAYYAERCDSYQAARAALLRAVEALELEAAKADSWRQAAEGFRRERDDLAGRFATETKERERCRYGWANERARAEAAEKERDEMVAASNEELMRLRAMLSVERDASEGSRRYAKECHTAAATLNDERASAIRRAEAAESALAAMREALEDIASLSDARRRLVTAEAHEKALEIISRRTRAALASPPPAALSTETEAEAFKCDACGDSLRPGKGCCGTFRARLESVQAEKMALDAQLGEALRANLALVDALDEDHDP